MNNIENQTDLGNANRFVQLYGDKVRYCNEEKSWYIWTSKVWEKDQTIQINLLAEEVIKSIYGEVSDVNDKQLRMELAAYARKSESANSIKSMLFCPQAKLPIRADEFDKADYLVNVNNGIIDLDTGIKIPHDPKYMMSKKINYDYDPGAQCPKWLNFLGMIFHHDMAAINYIQKCLGLSISGKTDRVLPFLYGEGGNGKSVFSETMLRLFGDYAQKTSIAAFSLGDIRQGGDKPNSYVTRLRKARLVFANETNEDDKLNVSLIKDLTGGDTLTARGMYKDAEEFRPTHTIWIYGNHKPKIDGNYSAIERLMKIL